jgi:hypothetical protein
MEFAGERPCRISFGVEERPLITADEIRRLARGIGLPAGVVEKDYAITWLLYGLYHRDSRLRNPMVLKGGTAIRKVYFPETWRLSEDLDFTFIGRKRSEAVRAGFEDVFSFLASASGIAFSLQEFNPGTWSIFANVQYVGPLGGDLLPTAKAVGFRVSSDVFPLVAEAVFHRKLARFATLGPFTIEHGSRQGFIHPAFWLGQLDDPFIRVQPGGSGHRPFTTTRSAGHRSVVWRPIGDLHSDSRLPKRKCCIRDISFSESASGTLFIPRLKHVGFLARFRSKKLIAYKDVKDVDVLALSLATRSHLWSEDKHFEGIKEIRLLRTKDLI